MDGWREPSFAKKQNINNTKNPAGLLKESAQIFEHIPNGGCQWDRKYIYIYGLYMIVQEAEKTKRMAIHTVHGAGAGDNIAYMGLAEKHHRLFIVSTDPGWVPPRTTGLV